LFVAYSCVYRNGGDSHMTDQDLHRKIRELRISLGMTQEEFAHAVAVTFSTVNRWENGHAKPSKLARRAMESVARRRQHQPQPY
jgi:DNA-binding transcriptional regulator YiaG